MKLYIFVLLLCTTGSVLSQECFDLGCDECSSNAEGACTQCHIGFETDGSGGCDAVCEGEFAACGSLNGLDYSTCVAQELWGTCADYYLDECYDLFPSSSYCYYDWDMKRCGLQLTNQCQLTIKDIGGDWCDVGACEATAEHHTNGCSHQNWFWPNFICYCESGWTGVLCEVPDMGWDNDDVDTDNNNGTGEEESDDDIVMIVVGVSVGVSVLALTCFMCNRRSNSYGSGGGGGVPMATPAYTTGQSTQGQIPQQVQYNQPVQQYAQPAQQMVYPAAPIYNNQPPQLAPPQYDTGMGMPPPTASGYAQPMKPLQY